MSTYVDYRAQRTTATANAEVQLAHARIAELQAKAKIRRDDKVSDTEQKNADKLARQAGRQAWRRNFAAGLRRLAAGARQGMAANLGLLLGLIAMGAPIVLAWAGQGEAAAKSLGFGALGLLMPVAVEGGAWYLAYLTHQALNAGRPTGLLRVATWVFALIAAGLNLSHGLAENNATKGVGLGLCSLFGPVLWELTVISRQRALAGRTGGQIRTALWRRVRYPRLSWAAASIAAARGEGVTPESAWQAAWMDRFGVGPEASRRDRQLGKAIVKSSRKADRKTAKAGAFMIVGGVILRADMTGLTEPSMVDSGTPYSASVQGKLSPATAELLAKTRTAIEAGQLPVTPSARAIRELFGGGTDAAREVRDVLADNAPEVTPDPAYSPRPAAA